MGNINLPSPSEILFVVLLLLIAAFTIGLIAAFTIGLLAGKFTDEPKIKQYEGCVYVDSYRGSPKVGHYDCNGKIEIKRRFD